MSEQKPDLNPLIFFEYENRLPTGAIVKAKISVPRWGLYVFMTIAGGVPVVPQVLKVLWP